MWSLQFPNDDANEAIIEEYYDSIVTAIKKAESETLPVVKFKQYLKPYWNRNLTLLRDYMRSCHRTWVNGCHCYNQTCEFFREYKDSKRKYRDGLRSAVSEYESSVIQKLEDDVDIDQKSVWSILNQRKKHNLSCTALHKDGHVFTDTDNILKIWHEHFTTVFADPVYSELNRKISLSQKVDEIRECNLWDSINDKRYFNFQDVLAICESLKSNKACGHDRIAYEHVKYGGKLLIRHLHRLFNIILQNGYIPSEWRKKHYCSTV